MKRFAFLLVFTMALSAGFAVADEPAPMDASHAIPWTSKPDVKPQDEFTFAIVSDRTGGHRKGVFESAMEKLNLLRPEFVMCVGDLIEGYSTDQPQIDEMRKEMLTFLNSLDMRFYLTQGNHDISNDVMRADWVKRFGSPYYSFVHKNVLFMVLATGSPDEHSIDKTQADWACKTLAENAGVRWTFVFMHAPQWVPDENPNPKKPKSYWGEIETALKSRPHTVFAGHWHDYVDFKRNGQDYIVLATTGGSTDLKGPDYGQFDEIVWVTVGAGEPKILNLDLAGLYLKDVRTEEMDNIQQKISAAVTLESLFIEQPEFSGATTQAHLINKTPYEIKARLAFGPSTGMIPSPYAIEEIVPANTTKDVPIRLTMQEPMPSAKVQPLPAEWSMSFTLPGREKPVVLKGTTAVILSTPLACPKAEGKITLDGKLDDWKVLPISSADSKTFTSHSKWNGPADSAFRMATAYDDQYVYIAVETDDDSLFFDPTVPPWSQDGLEFRIDARSREDRQKATTMKAFTDIMSWAVSPGATGSEIACPDFDKLPQGTKIVCVRTDKGMITEIAIPADYFNKLQGGQWKDFRLNVYVDDKDKTLEGAASFRQFRWQPGWKTASETTGTFVRQ